MDRIGTFSFTPENYRPKGKINLTHRRNFYLDEARKLGAATFFIEGYIDGFVVHPGMAEADFLASIGTYPYTNQFRFWNDKKRQAQIYKDYIEPLATMARDLDCKKPFLVLAGDNTKPATIPAFCKSRPANFPSFAIIQKLDYDRHFGDLNKLRKADCAWREKAPRLVWRGSTTGSFAQFRGTLSRGPRSYVADVVERVRKADVDVGYSSIVQVTEQILGAARYAAVAKAVKPPLSLRQQLRAKFLLALEGNDTATGLKWMLASNSAVIMPAPTIATWACERFLQPWVHFIPVRPDLADLEEVFRWCLENDETCLKIARRSRRFMNALMETAVHDEDLMRELLIHYERNVALKRATSHGFSTDVL